MNPQLVISIFDDEATAVRVRTAMLESGLPAGRVTILRPRDTLLLGDGAARATRAGSLFAAAALGAGTGLLGGAAVGLLAGLDLLISTAAAGMTGMVAGAAVEGLRLRTARENVHGVDVKRALSAGKYALVVAESHAPAARASRVVSTRAAATEHDGERP